MTYYDILEINPNASPEVVTHAYRALTKKYHPDKQANESGKKWAEPTMKIINEAYEVLSDEGKRKNYDSWLSERKFFKSEKVYEFSDVKADITQKNFLLTNLLDLPVAILTILLALTIEVIDGFNGAPSRIAIAMFYFYLVVVMIKFIFKKIIARINTFFKRSS